MSGGRTIAAALLLAAATACTGASASSSPEDSYRKGIAALASGQPRTARVELMNALQANPNDTRARLAQARTYLLLGDGVAAESEIRRATDSGVPAAGIKHLLAHALLLQREPQRAIAESEGVAGEHEAYAARIRGRAFIELNDGARAAGEFDRAIRAGERDARVWTDVAFFRRWTGDQAAAVEAADRAAALDPRNVEALTLRGELTRSQYGLAAALPWFDRALEIDPDNVTALLERASTLGDLGRMSDMLADTRRVLSLSNANPVAYYLQAMLAARGGDFELARSIYERTGGRLDETPSGLLLASAIDYQTGNARQAVLRLHRLVAWQPANLKARRLLGAAQWRTGDAAGTVETLRPLAERPDADSYTLTLIAQALHRQGDTQAAAAFFARAARPQVRTATSIDGRGLSNAELTALRRTPVAQLDTRSRIAVVAALLGRGIAGEALERARALQRDNPGVPDVHILVGDARGMSGDFAGAAEEYRKAANLAFSEPVAFRLIEALRRSSRQSDADGVLQLYLQQNPRNVPALIMLAGRHMQARNWAEAADIYEGLRSRLGDRDASILSNLAWAYSEQSEHQRAVALARRAWELDSGNPATADTLGWALFRSGERAEGLSYLERAVRGAPSDAEIRRRLDAARRG